MTHQQVQLLIHESLDYQDDHDQAAAIVAVMISQLAGCLTRSQRIAYLVRVRAHLCQLIDLGVSDLVKPDAVARMLGVVPR